MRVLLLSVLIWLTAALAIPAEISKPKDRMQALLIMYDALRAASPDMAIEIDESDESLKVTLFNGAVVRLRPHNIYLSLLQTTSSAQRDAVLRDYVASTIDGLTDLTRPASFDPSLVFPVLRPADMLPRGAEDTVPVTSFPGGLVQYWVQDASTSTHSVTYVDLSDGKLTVAGLSEIALANLATKARQAQMRHFGHAQMITLDGYYESSLLLLPQIWRGLAEHLGTVVVAIPTRDVLLIADGTDPAQMADLRWAISDAYATYPHPISRNLFRWQADHWTVLPN